MYVAIVVHPDESQGVHLVPLEEVVQRTAEEIKGQVSQCGRVAEWRDITVDYGGLSFYPVPLELMCKDCFGAGTWGE